MAIVFKIKRKSDGLFSMGGSSPRFNKTGKIWKQKGHLTNHLNQLWNGVGTYRTSHHGSVHVYSDCEIIEYELVEQPMGPGISITQYLYERKMKKEDQARQDAERKKMREKVDRRKQYEELQKEFG